MKFPQSVKIKVHIESDGGFWAEFPDLPGCFTQGDNLSQLTEQVQDALLTYYDYSKEEAVKINSSIDFEGVGKVLARV